VMDYINVKNWFFLMTALHKHFGHAVIEVKR
jgi:hypothetical protein